MKISLSTHLFMFENADFIVFVKALNMKMAKAKIRKRFNIDDPQLILLVKVARGMLRDVKDLTIQKEWEQSLHRPRNHRNWQARIDAITDALNQQGEG